MAISPRPLRRKAEARPANPVPVTGARALAEELLAKQRKLGIPAARKPDAFPEVPLDITSLHDSDLSELYGKLDAFAAYVGEHLAVAEVSHLDCARRLKDLESRLALEALEGVERGKATVRKLEAFMDEEAVQLRKDTTYHKAEVKLLQQRVDGMERSIRVLSRDQSRREKQHDRRHRT